MKRLATLTPALAALLMLSTALAGTTSSLPAGIYRSTQFHYTLKFPLGWYSIQSEPGIKMPYEADLFCNSPDLADGSVWIEINFVTQAAELGDQSVVDVTRGAEDEDKFSVVKDTVVKHGAGKARALEGNTVSDGDPMYYYALAVPSKARHTVMVAEILGPPELMHTPEMQKQVRAMLDSFQVTD